MLIGWASKLRFQMSGALTFCIKPGTDNLNNGVIVNSGWGRGCWKRQQKVYQKKCLCPHHHHPSPTSPNIPLTFEGPFCKYNKKLSEPLPPQNLHIPLPSCFLMNVLLLGGGGGGGGLGGGGYLCTLDEMSGKLPQFHKTSEVFVLLF